MFIALRLVSSIVKPHEGKTTRVLNPAGSSVPTSVWHTEDAHWILVKWDSPLASSVRVRDACKKQDMQAACPRCFIQGDSTNWSRHPSLLIRHPGSAAIASVPKEPSCSPPFPLSDVFSREIHSLTINDPMHGLTRAENNRDVIQKPTSPSKLIFCVNNMSMNCVCSCPHFMAKTTCSSQWETVHRLEDIQITMLMLLPIPFNEKVSLPGQPN